MLIVPGPLAAETQRPLTPTTSPTWWSQYAASLRFSAEAFAQLERDSREIAIRVCTLGEERWRESTILCGAVVGSVQSGKTASMIGVSARLLDAGFDIVVVLAGLKNDLREQTALRFTRDLLVRGDARVPGLSDRESVFLHPLGSGCHGPLNDRDHYWAPHFTRDAHDVGTLTRQISAALQSNRKVILVAKKIGAALASLTSRLRDGIERSGRELVHLLVVDDESDEASVATTLDRATTTRIVNLWSREPRLRTAYVGYTATPAANLLQDVDNPLFPRDLVYVLKTPGPEATSLTYAEPTGIHGWHCGYNVFYHLVPRASGSGSWFARDNISEAERQGAAQSPELEEALIAYFVGGAMRLRSDGRRNTFRAAPSELPPPHTMLIHTSAAVNDHWTSAERVRTICHARLPIAESALRENPNPRTRLRPDALAAWLAAEPDRWRMWYEEFVKTRSELRKLQPGFRVADPLPSWDETRQLLLEEVFPNTALKVINSDDDRAADDHLDFTPRTDASGTTSAPDDVYTIIVGGNVLSRGLTIPGLCISYFTRTTDQPRHDSIAQMQRWFGYRGDHLEFCRLFTHAAKLAELISIGRDDEFLRAEIVQRLRAGVSPTDVAWLIAVNTPGLPTGKVDDIAGYAISPPARPFIRFAEVDSDKRGVANEQIVSRLFAERAHSTLVDRADPPEARGWILDESLSALEIADLIDTFEYSEHDPQPRHRAWFGSFNVLREMLAGAPTGGFFRSPRSSEDRVMAARPGSDPFYISAYLRLWHYAHGHYAGGGTPVVAFRDSLGARWDGRESPPPRFNVGVRFGAGGTGGARFPFRLGERGIGEHGVLSSGWGTRGTSITSYLGDEWFDMHPPLPTPVPIPLGQRPLGSRGLLLFYVIHRDQYSLRPLPFHIVTFALAIPNGGPQARIVLDGGTSVEED